MDLSKVISDAVDNASYKTPSGIIDLSDAYHLYLVGEELKEYLDSDTVNGILFGEAEDEEEKEYYGIGGDIYIKAKDKPKNPNADIPDNVQRFKKDGEKYTPVDDDETGEEPTSNLDFSKQKDIAKDTDQTQQGEPVEKHDFSEKEKGYSSTIQAGLEAESDYMEFESDIDKQAFLDAAKKLGDDPNSLTKDDIDVINKYARIADSSYPKLYTARKKDNFSSGRGKVKITSGKSQIATDYLEKLKSMGIETAAASTVKGSQEASKFKAKDLTAGKLAGGSTRTETVTSTEDSVTVGTTTLTKTEITDDMGDRERASAERKNRFIDKVSESESIEFVETVAGADEGTEDGRDAVCNQYPKKMAKFITDSLGTDIKPEEQAIIDQLDALGDIEDQAEYEAAALKIINDMDQVPTIRKGAADLTESIVYLILNKRGIPTKLPAGETFKVSDLISFPPDNIKDIAPESIITLTKEGGVSVKMKGGAPSGGEEKIIQTKFKNEETQGMLLQIVSNHNAWHSTGGGISADDMDDAESQNEAIEAWARNNDIIKDDEEIRTRKGKTPEEWAEETIALWESRGAVRGLTQDERELYVRGLAGYCRGGLLLEKIYNSDIDSQEFGNANLKTYKSKSAELELSDGVNSVSLMYFTMNPGFKFKDFKPSQPTAVYAGKLVHAEYDEETGKFK